MRIAFLILAHNQPTMLAKLINRLRSDSTHCFVHIDAKCDATEFKKLTKDQPGVTYVPDHNRVSIHWSGFTMVAATINLLSIAMQDERNFDRFCLLSGSDYPLKSMKYIEERLSSPIEFIQFDRRCEAGGNSIFDRRATNLFFGDSKLLNPRSGQRHLVKIVERLGRLTRRKFPSDVEIYYGPSWWCLTRNAVDAIFVFSSERPEVGKWFSQTQCADEMFFQTCLKASNFSGDLIYDFVKAADDRPEQGLHANHYVDWKTPNPALPRTLDLSDLPALKTTEALFGRKFDIHRSSLLLDEIDFFT